MTLSKLMEREVVVVPILICRSMLSPEPDSHDARLRVGMAAQWEHIPATSAQVVAPCAP